MNKYKAKPDEAMQVYGLEGPIAVASDPFGTLRASRWTNPEAATEKARTEGPSPAARVLQGVRSGVTTSANLALKTARRAGRMLPAMMPDWRAWLGARCKLSASELNLIRDEAKHRVLVRRMSGIAPLSEAEERAVGYITSSERRIHQASTELAVQGELSPNPMFIVSGWAARIRYIAGARPQIIGFLLPGDGIAIRGCSEPRATTSIIAHTTLETVDGTQLMRMAQDERSPGVGHAIGRLAMQDEEFLINQIERLTAMSAPQRIAHLALELHWRLGEAGLASERGFELPLEPDVLGNATGLTLRGVRGALGELKRMRAMRVRYGEAQVINPAYLARIGAFTPPRECGCGQKICNGQHPVEDKPHRRLIDGVWG